ncbi:MAG: hypothetical protein AB8F65_12445 [Woeseiaceae bacterium]
MNINLKIIALIAVSTIMLGAAAPADAARKTDLQDACETAVKANLEKGNARINRVSMQSRDGETSFWMTIRHKTATDAKSTRYRAVCTIDKAGKTSVVEMDEGWWQKSRRGRSPVAVD